MRIHLLALPIAQTTAKYDLCGFTQMTIRFARLLKNMGHTVLLYASNENEAPCDELITVSTLEEQETLLNATLPAPTPYQYAYIEEWSPLFQIANARIIKEIRKRKEPRDIICSIAGWAQHSVADAHPDLMFVEYSIGYLGSFAKYRVFESTAWQHVTHGKQDITDGRSFDAVIPCFYEQADFPFRSESGVLGQEKPFAVYCGRLIPRKGITTACMAAQAAGIPLKVIGHGDEALVTHGAEYLGALPTMERNDWMSRAQCVLTPTIYMEPFNQVAVEAQMCGTPVVSTNHGGFTETVEHGRTGFRCNYLGEFVRGIQMSEHLDRHYVRARAVNLYSMATAQEQYRSYFSRLELLWEGGWNSLK